MAAADSGYNATLWVLRGELALACFRVQADNSGGAIGASVSDLTLPEPATDFDRGLRQELAERYGESCEVLVHMDGGEGFAPFRRGGLPDRPEPPSGPAKQQHMDL